jgi:hypothetical protein
VSIPNGRYQAQVVEAIMGESHGGKDQLELIWEIAEGEHAGARVSSLSYFTGGAKAITLEMMKHLGWKEGDGLETITGKASISLYDDTYRGETTQKVKVYVPRADGTQTPESKRKSPAAAKAFLSRLTNSGGDAFDDDPGTPPPMPGDDAKPGSDDLPF